MPNYVVEVTAVCTILVLDAKNEEEAVDMAMEDCPFRSRHVIEQSVTLAGDDIAAERRHADAVVEVTD